MVVTIIIAVLVPVASFVVLALLATHWVHARQAVIVLRKTTGRVVNARATPGLHLVMPFLDETHAVDLTFHRSSRDNLVVLTADGITMMANVTVAWETDGAWIEDKGAHHPEELDRVLPFLDDAEGIVLSWTERVLRENFSHRRADQIQQALDGNCRFRTAVRQQIAERVSTIGVRVLDLTLICYPSPAIIASRMEAEARAQEIKLLADALGPRSDDILRLLALEMLRGSNHRMFTRLDIGDGDSVDHMPIQFVVGKE